MLRTKGILTIFALAALLLCGTVPARAQYALGNYGPGSATPANIAQITDKHNAQIPLDLTFTNSDGKPAQLRALFDGKPVILTMVYFSCPRLCGYTQAGLASAIMDGPRNLKLGQDYNVIVVSIDPGEKSAAAAETRKLYLGKMDKPESQAGFYYLTGDEDSIRSLASAIGFGYQRNPNGDGTFLHSAGIFICTPDGRLSQTIEGVSFDPDTVHYRLVEATNGRISSGLLGFALCCGAMRFNPVTGMYEQNRWFWVGTGGALLTIIVVGSFLAMLWRGEYKRAKQGGDSVVHTG